MEPERPSASSIQPPGLMFDTPGLELEMPVDLEPPTAEGKVAGQNDVVVGRVKWGGDGVGIRRVWHQKQH